MSSTPESIQKDYYAKTAGNYNDSHGVNYLGKNNEHYQSMLWMSSLIHLYDLKSILDIGAGTGRTIKYLQKEHPNLKIIGIEPVAELRKMGHESGISEEVLIEGDGNNIQFEDNSFDLVCEFGVLHHVPKPEKVVDEMMRVANTGIFISDSNNFGQGGFLSRSLKQMINFFGLWPTYNYLRTGGKKYQISEGDGLFYSYSVFNNFKQIRNACSKVQLLSTKDTGKSLYGTSSHVALFGEVKK